MLISVTSVLLVIIGLLADLAGLGFPIPKFSQPITNTPTPSYLPQGVLSLDQIRFADSNSHFGIYLTFWNGLERDVLLTNGWLKFLTELECGNGSTAYFELNDSLEVINTGPDEINFIGMLTDRASPGYTFPFTGNFFYAFPDCSAVGLSMQYSVVLTKTSFSNIAITIPKDIHVKEYQIQFTNDYYAKLGSSGFPSEIDSLADAWQDIVNPPFSISYEFSADQFDIEQGSGSMEIDENLLPQK